MPFFGNSDLFGIFFTLIFLMAFGMFAIAFFRSIRQWGKNNRSPRLTVPVTVVAKRTHISRRNSTHHHHTSTTYYVTFQVESDDRMEFSVSGYDYGMLVEGDQGDLSFQGTRFLGFART